MAILEIKYVPDPVLRKTAKPVQKISPAVRQLLDDMAETMYHANGVGLAAPQVGILKRVVVIDPQDDKTGLIELINPEIREQSEFGVKGSEGCLSIPGVAGEVERYGKLQVTALDRQGRRVFYEVEGWLARIFQHEIDHLEGVLFTDKAIKTWEVAIGEEEEAEGEPAEGGAE